MMRCSKKAMDARRNVQRMVIPFANIATLQTRFFAATRRDVMLWVHRVVTRHLFGITKLRDSCLALHPKALRRTCGYPCYGFFYERN